MADTIAGDAFAGVNQLEAGWHPLLGDERARATELLARATRIIKGDCPKWRLYELRNPGTCGDICCEMVRRAMIPDSNGLAPAGVTQMNTTTGSFSDGYTFANPMGNLYMLDTEKRRLGVGVEKAFQIRMVGGRHRHGTC